MSKLKRWLDRRLESLVKSEPAVPPALTTFALSLSEELGAEKSEAFEKLLRSKASFIINETASNMKLYEFSDKYFTDKAFQANVLVKLPSNFHRTLLQKSMNEFVRSASKVIRNLSFADLEKAVKPKDWSRVTNKEHADAKLLVDHAPHMSQFPAPPRYQKMLSSEMVHPQEVPKDMESGISAKMVHEIDDEVNTGPETFMAKPYHKKIESHTKSWVKHPISGWATMATKALFNAGGIGHLAEDVSTHEHEGTPLTVHKFVDYHKPIGSMQKYGRGGWTLEGQTVNPVDVHKIGVMDYLANNLDRHSGNLMVGTHTETDGHNPLLAIDHERNFQYSKPIWSRNRMAAVAGVDSQYKDDIAKESPWSYIKGSALNTAQRSPNGWYSHEHLVDWWHNNGHKIKDEMEGQLGSIKDETIRKHVRENFNHRWHNMNNWATKLRDNPDSAHMYAPESLGEAFDHTRITKPESYRITSGAVKSLPKNKRDALFAIADMVNKKPKLTNKQRGMLSNAIDGILNQMTPEEAGEALRSLADNPYVSTQAIKNEPDVDPKNKLLRHFWQMQGMDASRNPIYKYPHMEALANTIDSMPEDKRGMLKSWAESYRQRLAESKGAA